MMNVLVDQVLRHLDLDKEDITDRVANIGQTVADFDASQKRIEYKLDAIMRHLGIEPTETGAIQNDTSENVVEFSTTAQRE